jgi:hypothetical protein
MKAVHTVQKQASVGFSLLGIMSLQALIHLSLVSPLRRSRTFINLLAVLKFFIREAENLCSSK